MRSSIERLLKFPPEDFGLSAERQTVLSSRLMVLILSVTIIYYLIDQTINSNVTEVIFISMAGSSIAILLLNAWGYAKVGKLIGLLLFNLVLYNVSASEPYAAAVHLHLFTAGFIALVLFGHEDRILGIAFAILSFALYLISYFHQFSTLQERVFTPNQTTTFFMVNSIVFGIINIYLIAMILRLNYRVEKKLSAKNQETQQQNEELKKVNAELDRFVYSASHDLRSPLSSMAGLINLQKIDRPDSDIYLDMIEGRVQVMDKFIHDILDYSRNTRLQVMNEKIQLKNLIHEVWDTLKFDLVNDQPTIHIELNQVSEIITDVSRLRVVLNNLLANAIKYKDPFKAKSYISISSYNKANKCIIEVKDNGIGIANEHQSKVFDMFYRATAKASGSGLGLYIVKESLEKMNGTISVESQLGEGSTFRVILPC
jgi:signal transduction histidine kinase